MTGPVTESHRRASWLVDALARLAAERKRAPQRLRDFLKTAEQAARHEAALLGLATHEACNQWVSDLRPDGSYVLSRRRDACPPAFENNNGRAARRAQRPAASGIGEPVAGYSRPQAAAAQQEARQGPCDADRPADWQKGKARRAREAREEKADASETRFFATWSADRQDALRPASAHGPTASERLAALRLRVAHRAALT